MYHKHGRITYPRIIYPKLVIPNNLLLTKRPPSIEANLRHVLFDQTISRTKNIYLFIYVELNNQNLDSPLACKV